MIISHRHKFIFQHCRKTAGSSIAVALTPILGPRDIQIGCWTDSVEAGHSPNARFYFDVFQPRLIPSLLRSGTQIHGLDRVQKHKYAKKLGSKPQHASAERVRSFVGVGIWADYFKFSFVRNPYSKAVSDWKWTTRSRKIEASFSEFLDQLENGGPLRSEYPDNWPIYTIRDEVVVEFVGRYENLQHDLINVFCKLGLSAPKQIPHAKNSGTYDYRSYYANGDRQKVERLFGGEIEAFAYSY